MKITDRETRLDVRVTAGGYVGSENGWHLTVEDTESGTMILSLEMSYEELGKMMSNQYGARATAAVGNPTFWGASHQTRTDHVTVPDRLTKYGTDPKDVEEWVLAHDAEIKALHDDGWRYRWSEVGNHHLLVQSDDPDADPTYRLHGGRYIGHDGRPLT